MNSLRVWAPDPQKVEAQIDGRAFPMRKNSEGWWTTEEAVARWNCDYGFVLGGEGPFPDPRSPFQPHGIHGLSRLVRHDEFAWSDASWQAPPLSSAVIYELHVGTFTPEGNFEAVIPKLDHLVQLGVTHVELMPVNEFSGGYGWGYDGVDLFAPHHSYGGPDGLKRLVNECHRRGLAVLLDVVYNHLGPAGNYLEKFGPYFTRKYSCFWGEAVNFDGRGSDEVRRFFYDNALMWLRDYHFDGLRLDAVHAMFDQSAEHFLEQLGREVKQLEANVGRHLVLIAESDLNDPRLLWSRERGGFGLDAQWSDDFHHALHTVLTGEQNGYYEDFGRLADLAKALTNAFVYDGNHSLHRGRNHGRPSAGLSGHRFLGYLQNHDQVGNRAKGERSSQLMSADRLKIGAALVLTSPFVPMLFQGEEWGASTPFQFFTNHQDPMLGDMAREGRRKEFAAFGWDPAEIPDPQARETFLRSKLDWGELVEEPHASLLDWHERLIELRRSEPSLRDGRLSDVAVRFDESPRWFVVERGPIAVVCNLAAETQTVPLSGSHNVVMSSHPDCGAVADGFRLPPESVAILRS